MPTPNPLTDKIVETLRLYGPMTARDLCLTLGLTRDQCNQALRGLRMKRKTMPRRVRICDWVHDAEGRRKYIYPVFTLGDRPDTKKIPPRDNALRMRTRRAVTRARLAHASIFTLALSSNTEETHGKPQRSCP